MIDGRQRAIHCVVLAHDEEDSITTALRSIAAQHLWASHAAHSSVRLVANGCHDRTVARAAAFAATLPALGDVGGAGGLTRDAFSIVELAEAGKSRAWAPTRLDLLTHCHDDDVVVFMDADVELLGPDALAQLVAALDQPGVEATTCNPTYTFPAGVSRWRVKLFAAADHQSTAGQIWGPLYAMRAGTLRRVSLPAGILMEDAFIAAVIATDGLTSAGVESRVGRAEGIYRTEANLDIRDAVRSRARVVAGVTINHVVFSWIRGGGHRFVEAEVPAPEHAADFVDRMNARDAEWVSEVVRSYASTRRLPVHRDVLARNLEQHR